MIYNNIPDNPYLLLTPGPLSTSKGVRHAMLQDWCTWDDDYNVEIVQNIRHRLLTMAAKDIERYTAVLIQGSGSFGVEACLGTAVPAEGKVLILTNGAYGQRMIQVAERLKIPYIGLECEETKTPSLHKIDRLLTRDRHITHVAVVHCETTTGILNPLEKIARLVKQYHKVLIVDAMSSFGGIPMDISELGIDFLISSSNKCIQGVPGFAFVIARKDQLLKSKGNARSLVLDLSDQWEQMEPEGKWRYTSPTHVVRAFYQALNELEEEGGVEVRHHRYKENHRLLVEGMHSLGFQTLLSEELQSPIITSFLFPDNDFDFHAFYQKMKQRGFVLYPGKVSEADTFRVGTIGDIYPKDIKRLIHVLSNCFDKTLEKKIKEVKDMSKIEGVIFDWAGTTVDFGCFAPVNVFLEIFKKAGVEVTMEEARIPMGMLKRDHIKAMLQMPRISRCWEEKYGRAFEEKDIDDLYQSFEPLLLASLEEYTDPLPNVLDTVSVLRDMGLKIGSTTGYTDIMMDLVVPSAKEKGYAPDFVITPDATASCGRPYPYMIFRNIEALRITAPWKTVKVGDTVADIKEGYNAGVWSVGVLAGSSQMGLSLEEYQAMPETERQDAKRKARDAFILAGADFIINTIEELPALIEKINGLIAEEKRPNAW